MHIASFAIAIGTFAASASADQYYTIITNIQNGLNVTLNGTSNTIEFGPGSPCRFWTPYLVANGVKDWVYYGITGSRSYVYFRYPEYKSGAIAQPGQSPSLFRVEKDGDTSYIVALESDTPDQKLAWTAEGNMTTPGGNMVVSLRPYTRSETQRFRLTQEYVESPEC